MQLTEGQCKNHFDCARVLRLATADESGRPHLVPATFVRCDEVIAIAVDSKPKRHRDLKRLRNIQENPTVSVLVDHYDDDWTQLWWARADGEADIKEVSEVPHLVDQLARRYEQYREEPPDGPVVVISIHKWTGWAFAE